MHFLMNCSPFVGHHFVSYPFFRSLCLCVCVSVSQGNQATRSQAPFSTNVHHMGYCAVSARSIHNCKRALSLLWPHSYSEKKSCHLIKWLQFNSIFIYSNEREWHLENSKMQIPFSTKNEHENSLRLQKKNQFTSDFWLFRSLNESSNNNRPQKAKVSHKKGKMTKNGIFFLLESWPNSEIDFDECGAQCTVHTRVREKKNAVATRIMLIS